MNPTDEPVRFGAAIAAFVHAGVVLLMALHFVTLTADQVLAVMGFEGAAVILGQMLFTRQNVMPNAAAEAKIVIAHATDPNAPLPG